MGGRWDRGGKENKTGAQTKTLQGQLGLSALQTLGDACIDLRVALRMVHECLALLTRPTTPIPLTRRPLGIEWTPSPHFKINKTCFPSRPDKKTSCSRFARRSHWHPQKLEVRSKGGITWETVSICPSGLSAHHFPPCQLYFKPWHEIGRHCDSQMRMSFLTFEKPFEKLKKA